MGLNHWMPWKIPLNPIASQPAPLSRFPVVAFQFQDTVPEQKRLSRFLRAEVPLKLPSTEASRCRCVAQTEIVVLSGIQEFDSYISSLLATTIEHRRTLFHDKSMLSHTMVTQHGLPPWLRHFESPRWRPWRTYTWKRRKWPLRCARVKMQRCDAVKLEERTCIEHCWAMIYNAFWCI